MAQQVGKAEARPPMETVSRLLPHRLAMFEHPVGETVGSPTTHGALGGRPIITTRPRRLADLEQGVVPRPLADPAPPVSRPVPSHGQSAPRSQHHAGKDAPEGVQTKLSARSPLTVPSKPQSHAPVQDSGATESANGNTGVHGLRRRLSKITQSRDSFRGGAAGEETVSVKPTEVRSPVAAEAVQPSKRRPKGNTTRPASPNVRESAVRGPRRRPSGALQPIVHQSHPQEKWAESAEAFTPFSRNQDKDVVGQRGAVTAGCLGTDPFPVASSSAPLSASSAQCSGMVLPVPLEEAVQEIGSPHSMASGSIRSFGQYGIASQQASDSKMGSVLSVTKGRSGGAPKPSVTFVPVVDVTTSLPQSLFARCCRTVALQYLTSTTPYRFLSADIIFDCISDLKGESYNPALMSGDDGFDSSEGIHSTFDLLRLKAMAPLVLEFRLRQRKIRVIDSLIATRRKEYKECAEKVLSIISSKVLDPHKRQQLADAIRWPGFALIAGQFQPQTAKEFVFGSECVAPSVRIAPILPPRFDVGSGAGSRLGVELTRTVVSFAVTPSFLCHALLAKSLAADGGSSTRLRRRSRRIRRPLFKNEFLATYASGSESAACFFSVAFTSALLAMEAFEKKPGRAMAGAARATLQRFFGIVQQRQVDVEALASLQAPPMAPAAAVLSSSSSLFAIQPISLSGTPVSYGDPSHKLTPTLSVADPPVVDAMREVGFTRPHLDVGALYVRGQVLHFISSMAITGYLFLTPQSSVRVVCELSEDLKDTSTMAKSMDSCSIQEASSRSALSGSRSNLSRRIPHDAPFLNRCSGTVDAIVALKAPRAIGALSSHSPRKLEGATPRRPDPGKHALDDTALPYIVVICHQDYWKHLAPDTAFSVLRVMLLLDAEAKRWVGDEVGTTRSVATGGGGKCGNVDGDGDAASEGSSAEDDWSDASSCYSSRSACSFSSTDSDFSSNNNTNINDEVVTEGKSASHRGGSAWPRKLSPTPLTSGDILDGDENFEEPSPSLGRNSGSESGGLFRSRSPLLKISSCAQSKRLLSQSAAHDQPRDTARNTVASLPGGRSRGKLVVLSLASAPLRPENPSSASTLQPAKPQRLLGQPPLSVEALRDASDNEFVKAREVVRKQALLRRERRRLRRLVDALLAEAEDIKAPESESPWKRESDVDVGLGSLGIPQNDTSVRQESILISPRCAPRSCESSAAPHGTQKSTSLWTTVRPALGPGKSLTSFPAVPTPALPAITTTATATAAAGTAGKELDIHKDDPGDDLALSAGWTLPNLGTVASPSLSDHLQIAGGDVEKAYHRAFALKVSSPLENRFNGNHRSNPTPATSACTLPVLPTHAGPDSTLGHHSFVQPPLKQREKSLGLPALNGLKRNCSPGGAEQMRGAHHVSSTPQAYYRSPRSALAAPELGNHPCGTATVSPLSLATPRLCGATSSQGLAEMGSVSFAKVHRSTGQASVEPHQATSRYSDGMRKRLCGFAAQRLLFYASLRKLMDCDPELADIAQQVEEPMEAHDAVYDTLWKQIGEDASRETGRESVKPLTGLAMQARRWNKQRGKEPSNEPPVAHSLCVRGSKRHRTGRRAAVAGSDGESAVDCRSSPRKQRTAFAGSRKHLAKSIRAWRDQADEHLFSTYLGTCPSVTTSTGSPNIGSKTCALGDLMARVLQMEALGADPAQSVDCSLAVVTIPARFLTPESAETSRSKEKAAE